MKLFFFSLLLLLISCSDLTSTEDLDKSRLNDIFDTIKTGFYENDSDLIMKTYHQDFLHNENDFNAEKLIWGIRVVNYDQIAIENLEFSIHENWASANFRLIFTYNDEETVFDEPSEELGDLSYFYKEFDTWFVCGKDFFEKIDS
ncbi:MAG: hypothetical protein K8S23_15980 [Candidatus Cloacimonetes bacterium]|nr:hypothetical protein [Candidatus Cloacimonadota bacterium]